MIVLCIYISFQTRRTITSKPVFDSEHLNDSPLFFFKLPLLSRERTGQEIFFVPRHLYELEDLVFPFIRLRNCLFENLRKRRKERVKRFPSPYLISAPSALPCLFTDSRKGKRRRMERIQGTYERESRKEGTRGTPFTAQWAPLKPKVMKVSGCLFQSPSLAARFAT